MQAEGERSESECKINDGNGCNYIYGLVLIWLTKSLPSPPLPLLMSFYCQHTLKDSHLFFASTLFFPFLTFFTSLSLSFTVLSSVSVETGEKRRF